MMLITIVIPVYKCADFIEQCIDSVLEQDHSDIEIVLINDGSPDRCPQICDQYVNKDQRIRVIHKKNAGLSAARNSGIREAFGEYIIFLDCDDWWNSEVSLRSMLQVVEKNKKVEMFLFNSIDYNSKLGYAKRYTHDLLLDFNERSTSEIYKIMVETGDFHEAAFTKIFKTSFLLNNNLFFQEGLSVEDTEWFFRVMRCVDEIHIIDVDLLIYRYLREGSITNTIGFQQMKDMIIVINQSVTFYQNTNNGKSNLMEFELAQCAYLLFIVMSTYGHLHFGQRKEIREELKKIIGVAKHGKSFKVRLAYRIFKLVGISATSRLLALYVFLMKRYLFINKRKVEIS